MFQPCSTPHANLGRKSKLYFFIQQLVASLKAFPWSHRAKLFARGQAKVFPQTVLDTSTAWAADLSYGSQKVWFKRCFSPRWTIWYPLQKVKMLRYHKNTTFGFFFLYICVGKTVKINHILGQNGPLGGWLWITASMIGLHTVQYRQWVLFNGNQCKFLLFLTILMNEEI